MQSRPVLYLRSLLFWLGFIINTVFFGSLVVLFFYVSPVFPLAMARYWSFTNNFLLKVFCGITFSVEGAENLKKVDTAILLSKHQSTWETLTLHSITPYPHWVFKRELMLIPVFGWALAVSGTIAVHRGAGRVAIKQLLEKGIKKLKQGKWIIMFPEGTRTAPGTTNKYKIGGALLAEKSGFPVIPIAHNAGEFWPRHSFIKWPGKISVVIGPPIETKGKTADTINKEVFDWIENTMTRISDRSRWNRK